MFSPFDNRIKMGPHARDRFKSLHGTDKEETIVEHVLSGVKIRPSMVNNLCGRKQTKDGSIYVLCPTRKGIFVLVDEHLNPSLEGLLFIVTYLRLHQERSDFAIRLWPQNAGPSFLETLEENETDPLTLQSVVDKRLCISASVRNYYLTTEAIRSALINGFLVDKWVDKGGIKKWIIYDKQSKLTLELSHNKEDQKTFVQKQKPTAKNSPKHFVCKKYKTPDGSIFNERGEAEKHLKLLQKKEAQLKQWFEDKTDSFDFCSLLGTMACCGEELATLLEHLDGNIHGN